MEKHDQGRVDERQFLFPLSKSDQTRAGVPRVWAFADALRFGRGLSRQPLRRLKSKSIHGRGGVSVKRGLPPLRELAPRKQVILDLYYTKQNDSRSEPHHVHAIGASIKFHF